MALVTAMTAGNIANYALKFYLKGKAMAQTIQEKPLLAWLKSNQKSFSGGASEISIPIVGSYMDDTAGFLQGYTGTETALSFATGAEIDRIEFSWYEVFAGWWINWTDLKIDGITVTDEAKTSDHGRDTIHRLTSILQTRLDDFTESYARSMNKMCWKDGSQDSLQVPGLTALITKGVTGSGTIGGTSRATYSWWNHRAATDIAASPTSQTLSKKLRSEVRQLRRYGGRPNKVFAGSKFIEEVESEITEKGQYTVEGFTSGGKTDLGVAQVRMMGVGTFDYDPTMDDEGMSNAAVFLDSRHINLYVMDGEDNKVLKPARPYNYLVFLQGMTWTGAMCVDQLNCHGYYTVAMQQP